VLRIGTRGSALALAQARAVAAAIGGGCEIVAIESSGSPIEDKSRWTRGVEAALLDGEVDLAVHSAKDVPADRPDGIATAAVPAREDPRDRLVGADSISDLPPGARVGTASPRRLALVRSLRQDLDVIEMRGNVDTRLRKLEQGEADAAILAAAGLNRLDRPTVGSPLDADSFIPAAGQGCLLLECRQGDGAAGKAAAAIHDPTAAAELAAERAFVAALDADCHTAVGCLARCEGELVAVQAIVLAADGSEWIRDRVEGPAAAAERLGADLAARLGSVGAGSLLARARGEAQ